MYQLILKRLSEKYKDVEYKIVTTKQGMVFSATVLDGHVITYQTSISFDSDVKLLQHLNTLHDITIKIDTNNGLLDLQNFEIDDNILFINGEL